MLQGTAIKAGEVLLRFEDIPWSVEKTHPDVTIDTFTKDSITAFLLFIPVDVEISAKDVIRSSLLKFHPDKFNTFILPRMRAEDLDRTKEAATRVVQILNDIANEHR